MLSRRLLRATAFYGTALTVVTLLILYLTAGSEFYETVKTRAKGHYDTVSSAIDEKLSQMSNSGTGDSSSQPGLENAPEFIPTTKSTEIINKLMEKLKKPLYDDGIDSRQILSKNKETYASVLRTKIDEPNVDNLVKAGSDEAGTAKATFLCLVRNEDLDGIIKSIQTLQETFNNEFNYPYTFLNDDEFTEEFKKGILNALPAKASVRFGKIEDSDWEMPAWIDIGDYQKKMEALDEQGVGHAKQLSYHNMCRYYSKNFHHHPMLRDYKFAWRVEPGVSFYCQIDYDVFKFMEMNNKVYGFTLNLYDNPLTVETLWPTVMEFVREHPDYLHENGAFEWLKENGQKPDNYNGANGYSTCHFWTNFEITNLDFLRSQLYQDYVDFLDQRGGFYYERWGDAPVRSIALALFADKDSIHWFRDIGYSHMPYTNCPKRDEEKYRAQCVPGKFVPWGNLEAENCQATWIKYVMSEDQMDLY